MTRKRDLPLGQDPSGRYLPWVIGLMSFIASVAITAGLSLTKLSESWTRDLGAYITIEVPPLANDQETSAAEAEFKIREAVQSIPQFGSLKVLSTETLLSNFVDYDLTENDTKILPKLYELKASNASRGDIQSLKDQLYKIAPNIQVTEHQQTKNSMALIARSIQFISIGVVLIIILGAISIIAFTAQTSLIIHRNVIEILYLVGATPAYIARQFQSHASSVGFQSLVINSIMGILLWGAAHYFGSKLLFIDHLLSFKIMGPSFLVTSLMILFFISISARMTVKVALRSGL